MEIVSKSILCIYLCIYTSKCTKRKTESRLRNCSLKHGTLTYL